MDVGVFSEFSPKVNKETFSNVLTLSNPKDGVLTKSSD